MPEEENTLSIEEAVKVAAASIEDGTVEDSDDIKIDMLPDKEKEDKIDDTDSDSKESGDKEDKEESKDDEETTEEVEDEEEVSEADQVWAALNKNPRETIEHFAQQMGLTLTATDKKEVIQEAKDVVQDILKKHLGKDWEFLSSKLAPAMEEILASKVDNRFEAQDQQKAVDFTTNRISDLMKSDKLSNKVQGVIGQNMKKLFTNMPASDEVYTNSAALGEYVDNIYMLASNNVKKSSKSVKDEVERVKRQNRNLKDEDPSSVGVSDSFKVSKRPKNATYRDGVEAAMRGQRYSD